MEGSDDDIRDSKPELEKARSEEKKGVHDMEVCF